MNSHDLPDRYPNLYLPLPKNLKKGLVGIDYPLPKFENQKPDDLRGFRTALVTTHGAELPEFHVPISYLRDRGALVEVVTPNGLFDSQEGEASGIVVLAQWLAANVCVKADKKISDAKIEDYDAIIIIGGAWNPIMLRTDESILNFIRDAHSRRLLIASICHGPRKYSSTPKLSLKVLGRLAWMISGWILRMRAS
jgi:protease I